MKFNHELAAKQEAAIEKMLRTESDGGALLAFDMGLGKTRTACMFARKYEARVVLVVVPLQTMEDWQKTVEEQYPGMPVRIIKGDPKGAKKTPGADAMTAFRWRQKGVYLVTHQYWEGQAWVQEPVKKRRKDEVQRYRKVDSGTWRGGNFLFVFDESHRAANALSWTFKALMNLTPFTQGGPFKLSMSGTFMGDRFDGAYGATKWVWPHRTDIIPSDIFEWRKIWAEVKYDKFAPRNQKVVGEKEEGAFVSALPCYIREESNMPPTIKHDVMVTLYPEQRRVYDELDDKMVAWINENPLVAEYSITKRARQRQTTLAMPTIDFDEETGALEVSFSDDAQSAKIDKLFLEMEGKGELGDLMVDEPLLLLTDSQQFARLLTLRLNERYGDYAREWSGKVAREKGKQKRTADRPYRKGIKQDFIDGKLRYLVGVQSAMGTGTDGLQYTTAHIVVFMSRSDRRIDNEQGTSRLNRTGQEQEVHEVSFIGRDTVDTGQWSNQMVAAVKQQRSMKAKHRKEEKERLENERKRILEEGRVQRAS